jgi:uncharacterized DUF497 family protein
MSPGWAIIFDPAKEAVNQDKHGVSLSLLEAVLVGETVTFPDDRRDYGEPRFITFGSVDRVQCGVVRTPRGAAH